MPGAKKSRALLAASRTARAGMARSAARESAPMADANFTPICSLTASGARASVPELPPK